MKEKKIVLCLSLLCIQTHGAVLTHETVTDRITDTIASRMIDLDELVVVSQPKETKRLRNMPVASSIFTDKEMTALGISDLSNLSAYIPSFSMPSYGSRITSSIYIRGIGSRSGSPAAGVYYDGIPLISKSAINSHFYQTDRVDVLRGPQGTLYGINAEGGIVRIYSKNPSNYQGTDFRVGIGTGLYSNVEIAHYHRPNEKLSFSTAGFYSGQRGFFKNTSLDGMADLMNEAGGKARIIWQPTEKLRTDFTADYQYVNQNGFAYGQYNNVTDEFEEPATNIMNGYKRQMLNTGLNITYINGSTRLTSVTSWQYLYDMMQMDQDYLPEDYLRLEQRERMNALVQELTISNNMTNYWKGTSGIFFSQQWLSTEAPVFFGDAMNSKIVGAMGMPPSVSKYISLADNSVPGEFDTPLLNIGIYHESTIDITSRLMTTIGLRYDHQHVSIDYDTHAMFTLAYSGLIQGSPVNTHHTYKSVMKSGASRSYDQLLPKVGLTYRTDSKGSNIYATVGKGFRAGGYNLQMFSDIFQSEQQSKGQSLMQLMTNNMLVEHTEEEYGRVNNTISYEPETSWNYEIGTHQNLFNGHLHADISAFYMQIRNQQLSVMADKYGYGRMMINAGRSSSFGIETSLRGTALGGNLTWGATYSYINSTFRQYTDNATVKTDNGVTTEVLDYRGNYVPFVPNHTFSATADWKIGVSHTGLLKFITVGADISGNGKIYWDVENEYSQDMYATLGLHAMLDFGTVKVNIWGRNITDTKYNTFLVNSSIDGINRSFAQRGNPLRVGVDMSIHM